MHNGVLQLPTRSGERIDERDDIERLIGLCLRFGDAPEPMAPRLLVAMDGTAVADALAQKLIDWRRDLGWSFDVHLLIVHDFLGKEAAERLLPESGIAATAAARALLDAAGIGHTLHVVMGPPAQRIVERAQALNAALILMGTRGHGPLGSVLLGSVAYKVVHDSDRPVTLLRA